MVRPGFKILSENPALAVGPSPIEGMGIYTLKALPVGTASIPGSSGARAADEKAAGKKGCGKRLA